MADKDILKGSCIYMCPPKEIKWREKNKLLHILEIKPGSESDPKADPDRVIKQFSRSAAGKVQPSASDLRSSNVLLKTMDYLINNIVPLDILSAVEIYNFVNDRIQAIRQDITIQIIEDVNTVLIYEKCVRFYIISSYLLCEEPQPKFDQFLNKQQLSVCLEKLIDLYKKFQSEAVNEMISIHFCLNIDNCEKLYWYEIRFNEFFKDDLVKLTVRTCTSWIDGNFIRFFLCIERLPATLRMTFFHQFGFIRKRALKVVNTAYSSPSCQFPIEVLSNWLRLTHSETSSLCEAFSIKVNDKNVYFNKKNYIDSKMPSLKKESRIEIILEAVDISNLINGNTTKKS